MKRRLCIVLALVIVFSCFTSVAYAFNFTSFGGTGSAGQRIGDRGASLKKNHTGWAQAALQYVFDEDGVNQSAGYGWAEVWTLSEERVNSISGNDNKVSVADGYDGVMLRYLAGKGVVGEFYKFSIRVPDNAPSGIFTYSGFWSPENRYAE